MIFKSLFGFNEKDKNNINDENKNKNIIGKTENKILFGAPKENVTITPLSTKFTFGIKKNEEEKNVKIDEKR